MGKKPVLGIVSALCVGLALTGCHNCPSCQSDSAMAWRRTNPQTFNPQPTFQTNSAAAAPATAMGWNNSGNAAQGDHPDAADTARFHGDG